MSKDDLTMYMLEILDRYELPHTIKDTSLLDVTLIWYHIFEQLSKAF